MIMLPAIMISWCVNLSIYAMPFLHGLSSVSSTIVVSVSEQAVSPSVGDLTSKAMDESRSNTERILALRKACESAQEEDVDVIVAGMRQMLKRFTDPQLEGAPEYYVAPAMLNAFFEHCFLSLSRWPAGQQLLLSLAADVAADRNLPVQHLKSSACRRIADALAPLEVRQHYMLQVVDALGDEMAPEAFIPLVTAGVLDELRHVAFTAGGDRKPYNRAAVDLLAEYGDLPTAKKLRELARAQGKEEEWARPPGRLWKAEAQHDPQKLLDYIASGEWTDYASRPWALRKAVRLNVGPEKIRAAILSHSEKIGEHPGLKGELQYLKAEGLSSKVLRPEDLPGIQLPTTQPGVRSTTQPSSQPASSTSDSGGLHK